MEIKAVDGKLTLVTLFGPVAVGYGIGAAVIFLPMFLFVGSLIAFTPEFASQNSGGPLMMLPMIIMVPLILVMQGVMAAGFVILGLAIYRKWGSIRVVSVKETIVS